MPKVKLTAAAVEKFKAPKGERIEYFDATLPGFGVRVAGPSARAPEGRKSWFLFYRFGGEQRRLTLEPPFPGLSLADARRQAGDALQALAGGTDPAALKREAKAEAARPANTMTAVVAEFEKRHLQAKGRADRYIAGTRRTFDVHVLSRWGDRDIRSITRREVIALLDDVCEGGSTFRDAKGKKKQVPGGPIAANRTLAAVRALFNWALRRGIVESVPTAQVDRPGEEQQRDRTLSAEELRSVWAAAAGMGYPFGPFFQLALLTAQRREEVAGMRWADVSLEQRTWTIPAAMTKAGRGHVVPLSPLALEILKGLPKLGLYVLTSSGTKPIKGHSVAKRRIDAAIAARRIKDGDPPIAAWRVHDLRRTAATEMGRLGAGRFVIGKVLNHSDRGVTAIYDRHAYAPEKRQALEAWSDYLAGLVKPPADNVVQLRAAVA